MQLPDGLGKITPGWMLHGHELTTNSSYGGEDSTSDISRGIFAGTLGTQRLLKMFKKVII